MYDVGNKLHNVGNKLHNVGNKLHIDDQIRAIERQILDTLREAAQSKDLGVCMDAVKSVFGRTLLIISLEQLRESTT